MKKILLVLSVLISVIGLFFSYIWYENYGRQLICETFYSDGKEWMIIGNGTYGTERFACENKNIRKIIITNENNFPVDIRHYYKFPLPPEMQEENDLPIWRSSIRTPTIIEPGKKQSWSLSHDNVPLHIEFYTDTEGVSFYFEKVAQTYHSENSTKTYENEIQIRTPQEEKARKFPLEDICLIHITLADGLDKERNLRWIMETEKCT